MIATALNYRTCRICHESKPLDAVHYAVYCETPLRYHTACIACEVALAERRTADFEAKLTSGKVRKPIPLTMGDDLIDYAERGAASRWKAHGMAGHSNNPTGRNQFTSTDPRPATWHWFCKAIEACKTDAEADAVYDALPADWNDDAQHAAFVRWARGIA